MLQIYYRYIFNQNLIIHLTEIIKNNICNTSNITIPKCTI